MMITLQAEMPVVMLRAAPARVVEAEHAVEVAIGRVIGRVGVEVVDRLERIANTVLVFIEETLGQIGENFTVVERAVAVRVGERFFADGSRKDRRTTQACITRTGSSSRRSGRTRIGARPVHAARADRGSSSSRALGHDRTTLGLKRNGRSFRNRVVEAIGEARRNRHDLRHRDSTPRRSDTARRARSCPGREYRW